MNLRTRSSAAALAGGLALAAAALPAFADEVPIPEEAAPLVGMAYDPATEELWLAGPDADDGEFTEAGGSKDVSLAADLVSVQALAWSGDRLWVGDIGDADAEREFVVVYRLGSTEGGRTTYHAYDLDYEDGPRDARALLISGRGNIYVVSAGEDPGIYRVSGDAARDRVNTMVRVQDAPAGVTDGVFLSDGSTMALRTATGIEYIDAMAWEPLVTDTLVGAPDGESLALGPEDVLFVGGNPGVRTAEVPSSDVTTTVAPEAVDASPGPEGTESPDPAAEATETAEGITDPAAEPAVEEEGPARAGTIVALSLAGLVAVAAGIVTFFWRN